MLVDRSFESALCSATSEWSLDIPVSAMELFRKHLEMVLEKNRVMNLTRITVPQEAVVKHYADSLALAAWAKERDVCVRTLLDIGAGAGYPAVPLAILRPDWSITAVEATRKKAEFLLHIATQLRLTNLEVVHAHAAYWKPRRGFDVVTFRALGALGGAIEMCHRFVARGGYLVAYKTARLSKDEARGAERSAAAAKLDGAEAFDYELIYGVEVFPRSLRVYARR